MKRKLNVRLLRRIQRHILKEPRRFFMDWFIAKAEDTSDNKFKLDNGTKQEFAPCGTAACIAGWANILTGHKDATANYHAAGILNLPDKNSGGWSLFSVPQWPVSFEKQYNTAKTPAGRARAAVRRIDHLIKTGE